MGKEDLRAMVQSVQPHLAECYREAQPSLTRPDGTIHMMIRLEAVPDLGTVATDAHLDGDRHLTDNGDLTECFRETLLAIADERTMNTGIIDVHYPFTIE